MEGESALQDAFDRAVEIEDIRPEDALARYFALIAREEEADESAMKLKELAVQKIGAIYVKQGNVQGLQQLLVTLRPFFVTVPKAKTAKLVRNIIEMVAKIPNTLAVQIQLCRDCIEWTNSEKRTFLRQRIETKLAALYLQSGENMHALTIINKLLREVKRLDDKALLVEVHLLESHAHYALRNLPKSKAALTAGRAAANSIYCPPQMQAQIDLQAGILHAEEKEFPIAYSYFYESFEGSASLDDQPNAIRCLKYMLLCKIMSNHPEDVAGILLSGKIGPRYSGNDIDAMKAVAKAHQDRSLQAFQTALKQYDAEIAHDPIIKHHLRELHEILLTQNLVRLIEPYSKVQISHIAALIDLPLSTVEAKLSQMVLDKEFDGILDQGAGCLHAFEPSTPDRAYPAAIETMHSMGTVVDSLFERAAQLS
eukprot:TRINITY_DN1614_c0_g1_i1.p1 TRINITY_DN1614_c0_g1~~TRINITY_DN1614_c0_g1_i1.p1  ORF type:complete len:432 (-),score=124.58 TRINITY_DN1614_c0_g1_i1:50-1324(-)